MKEFFILHNPRPILVDDEDFVRLSNIKWTITKTKRGYEIIKNKEYPIANIVLNCLYKMFDHKDRNSFNNQKSNLREATKQQNAWNLSKINKPTSSKYKGAYLDKRTNVWRAKITFKERQIYLGGFKTEQDAALAYNEAASKYFGEFASLNIL